MTDKFKPTPEQIRRACDLANGGRDCIILYEEHYGHIAAFTALADTIAKLDAMQAERDRATADLGTIDEIASLYGWGKPDADTGKKTVAAIAAPYRVETDPLVAALIAIHPTCPKGSAEEMATALSAELAKRGLEIGRSA